MKALLQSGVARLVSLLPASLATLLTSRLIVTHWGLSTFDGYALVVAVMALLPLNDLGVGAAVTSAFAEHGPSSPRARRTLLTALRVLSVSAAVVILASVAIGAAGGWPRLLGADANGNWFYAAAVGTYALSFVPGAGQSMLLGLNRNHVAVWVSGAMYPLTLVLVVASWAAGARGGWVLLAPAAAILVVNCALAAVAGRAAGLSWRQLLRDLPAPREHPGASIRAVSGPMLVVTLAVPLALQSDRLVLSHVSTGRAVADYAVTLQLFAPVLALVTAAAAPLWPIWTRVRTAGERGPTLSAVLLGFCGATALCCAVVAALADPLGHLVGGSRIGLGILLPVAAGAAIVMQAAAFPVAMALMDPPGIRFVATCSAIGLPLNVGLSVVLGQHLGASGPLWATTAVGLLVQTVPAVRFARRRAHLAGYAGRHRPGLPSITEPGFAVAANLPS